MRLLGIGIGLSLLAGCGNCGSFEYAGWEAREECGYTYGTSGVWYDRTDDEAEDGDGVIVLTFGHDAPPGVFDFEASAYVEATFLADDLGFRKTLDLERAMVKCVWVDRGRPLDSSDDVGRNESATEASIRFQRPAVSYDVGDIAVRRFDWRIECPDGVMQLDAQDNVELVRTESAGPFDELTAYLEARSGEGTDTGDTGDTGQ